MAKHKAPGMDLAKEQFEAGLSLVNRSAVFAPLARAARVRREAENKEFPEAAWARVSKDGLICCHPTRRGAPEEWAWVIAHCLLHLGLGHFEREAGDIRWNAACDCMAAKFLSDLKFGQPPASVPPYLPPGLRDEHRVYESIRENSLREYTCYGTMGPGIPDMVWTEHYRWNSRHDWRALFVAGLQNALRSAVDVAGGKVSDGHTMSKAARAKEWFISSYPLLGAIASGYTLIEEPSVCQRFQISIAAISPALQEIYINPAAGLDGEELRFVMAHEFLHAALRHETRCQGRDPELWNVACDYVINGWLHEMRLGEMPTGCLYDEQFRGLSAEDIYDRIVTDMRRYRKLATLRGTSLGDILSEGNWWEHGPGVDLDEFYRSALSQGLEYHIEQQRGYLPSNLVEEIRALSHPPIPWDAELARWFDEQFSPVEKVRSYARPSRRQSSTPDIPRPAWRIEDASLEGRTFGVVLDTSGSMDRALLAASLGAIASYSAARDVNTVRVVFCDAAAYDQGYMRPEDIAGTVRVRGRGGTVLQPGIDLLDADKRFPPDAPLLIITDGCCDHLHIHGREHAFLIPKGAHLPFVPKGKVFRMTI